MMMKDNLDFSILEEASNFLQEIMDKYGWEMNSKGEIIDKKTKEVIMNEEKLKEIKENE